MPTVVTNPLGELVTGMLQGYQLANQIKHQAMQQEAQKRMAIQQDREMQVNDIQTQMMLGQNARPVNAGSVADVLPAAPEIPGQPQMQGGNPQIPIVRPVDKSRRVKYQDKEYELFTPEEQIKRTTERAAATKRAGSTLIQTPKHLQDLGLPAQIYVPDDHVMQYAEQSGLLQPMDTPEVFRSMGGPAQLPVKSLPSVVSAVNSAENRKATDARTSANITSREKIAGENRTAANTRADNANKTRIAAAGVSGAGTDGRGRARLEEAKAKEQREALEADQKELRRLEGEEAKLHAEKLQTGQMIPGAKDDEKAFTNSRGARLSGLDLRIKGIQESKKKLIDKWQPKGGMQTQAAPQQARPRATNPQTGEVVEFDGKAWVKATGTN
jgi:hypothetical protein